MSTSTLLMFGTILVWAAAIGGSFATTIQIFDWATRSKFDDIEDRMRGVSTHWSKRYAIVAILAWVWIFAQYLVRNENRIEVNMSPACSLSSPMLIPLSTKPPVPRASSGPR